MTQYGSPYEVEMYRVHCIILVRCEDSDGNSHEFRVPYVHEDTQDGLTPVFKFDETKYISDEGDETVMECPEEIKRYIQSDEILQKVNKEVLFVR